ncbi:(2Fe-2S) ferredoxin domain-containing protein [Oscillatoria acuminata]|uniref:Ferredoxin n=1 Tax=Oscillatoria acuminata PCC 6304 TaxID=56110 RepID=K9TFX9_9CYAN|nr:(2Fe-2S) ferredoxin domain-containing protein [Oscillatoria acuminata]AFY81460.1 ferredoxin [Oscillatoria acuminata PCC 6304]
MTPPDCPNPFSRNISICQHQSCQRHGSLAVLKAFEQTRLPPGVTVNGTGCLGQCSSGPTVKVNPDNVWYCRVTQADVPVIVEQHLENGEPVDALLNPRIHFKFSF